MPKNNQPFDTNPGPRDGDRRDGSEEDPIWRHPFHMPGTVQYRLQNYLPIETLYQAGRRLVPERPRRHEAANYEFWPLKIIKTTCSPDLGVGCYGCSFCVASSQPLRSDVQGPPYIDVLGAEELFDILRESKVFTDTDIRLRLFNDTDATLPPVSELEKFGELVADFDRQNGRDHVISLLTHRTLNKEFLGYLERSHKKGRKVVLTASVTPPHPNLHYMYPMERQLDTFFEATGQKVLNFAPLIDETVATVTQLLESGTIPLGTYVTFSPLTYYESVPMMKEGHIISQPATVAQLDQLARIAVERGYHAYNSNECAISTIMDRPSYDYAEVNHNHAQLFSKDTGKNTHLTGQCGYCSNETCKRFHGSADIESVTSQLETLVKELGFTDITALSAYSGLIILDVEETERTGPLTKSDTAFLSTRLGIKVTGVNSKARPNEATLQRWRAIGFLPVDKLEKWADRLQNAQDARLKNRSTVPVRSATAYLRRKRKSRARGAE